jgi:dipeptidyl aminopeptidase/acylaminoacyl peptidase
MRNRLLSFFLVSLISVGCGSASSTGTTAPGGGAAGPGAPGTSGSAGPTPTGHPATNLIPRDVFFGNPEKSGVQISPNGKSLSWLAPVGGVMNVWVAPLDKLDQAKSITADSTRPVRAYFWAFDNKHILYQQDTGGDENWHIFSVEVATGKAKDITPIEKPESKVAARIEAVTHKAPGKVIIAVNERSPQFHDSYEVDIASGKKKLLVKNDEFAGVMFDDDMRVKLAMKMSPDGGMIVKKAGGKPGTWDDFITIPQEDALTTQPLGFDKFGKYVYMWDSRGRDTGALMVMALKFGQGKVVAEDPRADGSEVLVHPTDNTIQAVGFTYERTEWKVLDKRVQPDFDKLEKLASGEFAVTSRTLDDKKWIVAAYSDAGPVRYYLWDRGKKKETFLFSNRPALEKLELATMKPVVIPSRDKLNLVSYLSLPVGSDKDGNGVPEQALPMVLLVHGGPWARDHWGFNPIHQLLANRGYAVLSVNFRGSTGFGKKFINAANREWAGKMHDDLVDAVQWAGKSGVADPKRVCIMGGSYGGYATLVGLTFTPDLFACGVDIVGPSNLITLIQTVPPYWMPIVNMFKARVGDWTTPEGQKELTAKSPLTHADKIQRPLLIGQGANDPRVKQAESKQMVDAMQAKKIPVTYVVFPDEGHGFARPENSLAFWAVTEAFLSAYLGGTFQPLDASAFKGSTITVPVGARAVPQLEPALPSK